MMSDQIEQFSVTQEGDEKGVTGLWEEGNYKQALDLGYRQALQSAPLSTFAGVLTMTGNPVAASMVMGIPAYGQKMIELKDSDLKMGQKRWNAFMTGSAEALSEVMGAVIGLGAAKIAVGAGKKELIKKASDMLMDNINARMAKYGAAYVIDTGVEGFEEYANRLAENAIDIETGIKSPDQIWEGTTEALVSGSLSAAFLEAPSQVFMAAVSEQQQAADQKKKDILNRFKVKVKEAKDFNERIQYIKEPMEGVAGVESSIPRSPESGIHGSSK